MDEKISFEKYLFGNGNEIVISDMEFCVDRIIKLPKIRPLELEKAVRLCIEYSKFADFRQKILEKINECPVLIYQMHMRGIFAFEEIKPYLKDSDAFLLCIYFRREINDFSNFIKSKYEPSGFDSKILKNERDIDQLINYGYLQSSIEYCIKYDLIDELKNIGPLYKNAKWSLFEWSYKPESLDLLSFAGFFGSIKCFSFLFEEKFEINENLLSMVVCSGCFDIFHKCQVNQFVKPKHICQASEFCHIPLLDFILKNEANIKEIGDIVLFLYLLTLLFIKLLKKVILVLLNILLIKKLI